MITEIERIIDSFTEHEVMKDSPHIRRVIKNIITFKELAKAIEQYVQDKEDKLHTHYLNKAEKEFEAHKQYVIKARIEELERIRGKLGTLNGQIFDHFKNERIAELKKGLTE